MGASRSISLSVKPKFFRGQNNILRYFPSHISQFLKVIWFNNAIQINLHHVIYKIIYMATNRSQVTCFHERRTFQCIMTHLQKTTQYIIVRIITLSRYHVITSVHVWKIHNVHAKDESHNYENLSMLPYATTSKTYDSSPNEYLWGNLIGSCDYLHKLFVSLRTKVCILTIISQMNICH